MGSERIPRGLAAGGLQWVEREISNVVLPARRTLKGQAKGSNGTDLFNVVCVWLMKH